MARAARGHAAPRAPLRAAGREPRLPDVLRRAPRPSCSTRRACSGARTTAVHATHLTDRRHQAARRARSHRLLLPHHRARPGRRHRPGPRPADAGSPLALGSDQHAVIDPFEEIRGLEMHERLATNERGRFTPDELVAAATATGTAASAGTTAASSPRAPSPTSSSCAPTASARRVPAPARSSTRRPGRRRPRRRRRARRSCATAHHRLGRRRAAARRRPRPRAGPLVSSTLVTGIGELHTCDGLTPDRLGARHDAALVAEDGRIAWVGPRRRRTRGRPPPRRRWAGRRAGLRRHPHPPRLRRRPRRGVRRPDGGPPYDGGGIGGLRGRHPRGDRRRAARAAWPPGSPRCAPRARRPSRSRAATA